MMLLSKVVPQSIRSFAGTLKIKMYPYHRNLATVFALWLGVMQVVTCFIKWSWKTKMLTMFGGWSNSIVISMLVISTCSNSKGAVAMMGCIGTLAQVPSCWMHCSQLLMGFCICVAIPGHQNWSCSRYRVCYWPWCPASQWHPIMAATQWAMGTKNSKTSSNLPASVWQW